MISKVNEYAGDGLLHTKLLIPNAPENIIKRPLLFGKLDGVLSKKLAIIQAPAGFGKTTLVNSWLHSNQNQICPAWISLDTEDNDTRQFWYYVISAVEKLAQGSFQQPLSMLQSMQPYPIESVLKVFINALLSLSADIVLVLDDYHVILAEEVQVTFEYFLKHLPHNVHVILTTRMMPSFALARMRVNSEMLELKADDLRFSEHETAELLNKVMGLNFGSKEVSELAQKTEGWVAALKIAALSFTECWDSRQFLSGFDGSKPELLEYLSEEIISQFPENIRYFMRRTAILDILNQSICQELTGEQESQQILEMLARNDLFTVALDEKRENFRYHHIMACFLRSRLIKCCPEMVDGLYLQASTWYETNGYAAEALEYSQKSQYHENTARLIEKYAEQIFIREDYSKFISVVEKLPADVLQSHPEICIYYAFSFARLGLMDREESVLIGKGISLDHERFKEFAFEVALVRSTAARCRPEVDIEAVIYHAEAALCQKVPVKLLHALVNGNLGNAYALKGELKKAEHYFRQALHISKKFGNPYLTFISMHLLAQIQVNFGQLHGAMEIYGSAVALLNEVTELITPVSNFIYLGMGNIFYEQGQLEQARAYIKKCIELSELRKDSNRQIQGCIAMAKILHAEKKYGELLETIDDIDRMCVCGRPKFILLQFFADIGRILLNVGQLELFKGLMNKYGVMIHAEKSFIYEDEHIAMADYFISTGEYNKADELLDALLQDARCNDRVLSTIRILLLKALAAKGSQDKDKSQVFLREALCLGLKGGFVRVFIDHGVLMKELLLELVDQERSKAGYSSEVISYTLKLLSYFNCAGSAGVEKEENFFKGFKQKEMEVLKYLISGYSNREIADALYLSVSSVKKYVNSIFEKLNVSTRAQAVAMARKFL